MYLFFWLLLTGQELLVNLGGEQIYLFDINSQQRAASLRYLPPASVPSAPPKGRKILRSSNGILHLCQSM
jgi:hypothetical protein